MLVRVTSSLLFLLAHVCSGYPNGYYYVPSLSAPERHPQLGLYPRYQALVYNYINGMAGPHQAQPAKVNVFPTRIEDFGLNNNEPTLTDGGSIEPVTEKPGVASLRPSSLLPSDFILLAAAPQSQFFGSFDVVKNKKMKLGVDESALPPIGGVVSNYILQQNKSPLVKRQSYYYDTEDDEGVVVNAQSEPRAENGSSNSSTEENQKDEPQPSVAQSKPSAIALAGVGGVAQAAPVGTAVVGEGGLAIAAPSATAVAGQGTGGALQIAGDEKMKKSTTSEPKKEQAEDES